MGRPARGAGQEALQLRLRDAVRRGFVEVRRIWKLGEGPTQVRRAGKPLALLFLYSLGQTEGRH